MSQAERGLFERVLHCRFDLEKMREVCTEFEQRLAEAEKKAAIVDAMKAYDESEDDAEFESPHPVFLICEERDAFMFKCRELNGKLAEAERVRKQAVAVNSHWNEFGPEHGFAERMDHLHCALTAPLPEKDK